MLDYLYGELNKVIQKVTYTGETSLTAAVVVDNTNNTITVNVISLPVELLSPNIDILSGDNSYILVGTVSNEQATYAWMNVEEFLSAIKQDIASLQEAIQAEASAREEQDAQLQQNIDNEVNRAESAESALSTRISKLEIAAVQLLYNNTIQSNPQSSDIETFVTSLDVTPKFTEPYQGISVVVPNEDGSYCDIWRYDAAQTLWINQGRDTVTIFTTTSPGMIVSSTTEGYVTAQPDGTGYVSGWTELLADVATKLNTDQVNSLISKAVITTDQLSNGNNTFILDGGNSNLI